MGINCLFKRKSSVCNGFVVFCVIFVSVGRPGCVCIMAPTRGLRGRGWPGGMRPGL